ncbi:MAG: helix-turn-helix domain-containing protein [Oscillospiraceae bacterium]|nr:helix-turn-helix domain-containing protein [Oscillospiraceae bacterium]
MQGVDSIKSSLAYIEHNLKAAITTEELAGLAGYSMWHYCRLFAQTTGMPVAAYISKRRLDRALADISAGPKAIDVVLDYGFDTYAGFYKAFVRLYGCSPKKYLSLYGRHEAKQIGGIRVMEHLTERELRKVLTNWEVPQDLPIYSKLIMDSAKESDNEWFVGDDYLLRSGTRDERNLRLNSLRIETALAAQGFSKGPIATKAGAAFLEGARIFTLTHKAPGERLPKADRFGDNRRAFGFKYGAAIAKLHRALAEVETDIMPDKSNLYQGVTEWAMPEVKKQNEQWNMGLPAEFFTDFTASFGPVFERLPKQLIHRDPNPTNILFDQGEVSGFIEFDLGERNIRLFDPCYCATGILVERDGVDDAAEKWLDVLTGILHGYDSVNPLTQEEKQSVFYVLCAIQMICVAWFEGIDELKELAKTNREMLWCIVADKGRIMEMFG